ncbi:hypothetical protein CVE32_23070 [Pseudomonas syringae pv. actinidiae]|nr:hypothetical protein [Pseudomonas syringae pv. actinidiae]
MRQICAAAQRHALPCPWPLHINESAFHHDGTDDAECDVSDRAKEPDEVGPETEPGFCLL